MFKRIVTVLVALILVLGTAGIASAQTQAPEDVVWYARYYDNTSLEGDPVIERSEADVDNFWGFGSPDPAINPNNFSARWTAYVDFEPGLYRIRTISDDGIRVWIDGQWVIDNWTIHAEQDNVAYFRIASGSQTPVVVEYFENEGIARLAVGWESVEQPEEAGDVFVNVEPQAAPVGQQVELDAGGFPPNALVDIGFGRPESEFDVVSQARTDANGELETLARVPDFATPEDEWVWVVDHGPLTAVSSTFNVTGDQAVECGPTVTVQPGDTLYRIARLCDTSVAALVAANDLETPSTIFPGTVLNVPEEVGPLSIISPVSGPAGRYVLTSVDGFPANEQVRVGVASVDTNTTNWVFTTSTGSDGAFRTYMLIPADAAVGSEWMVAVQSLEGSTQAVSQIYTVTE